MDINTERYFIVSSIFDLEAVSRDASGFTHAFRALPHAAMRDLTFLTEPRRRSNERGVPEPLPIDSPQPTTSSIVQACSIDEARIATLAQ
jgi:hypothetical protein